MSIINGVNKKVHVSNKKRKMEMNSRKSSIDQAEDYQATQA